LVLNNRVVMAPMAQYMADVEGNLTDWHFSHYTSHAMGGMGLMFTEMTCVSPQARITEGCPGLWSDAQEQAWARMVNFVHTHSETKVACQLGHAGRKGATQLGWERADQPLVDRARRWPLVAASALPWLPLTSDMPAALDEAGMAQITADFVAATQRAQRAGFDLLELHCAHGYLLASFLSPLTNGRSDAYGGTVENRLRFPLAVFRAMRDAWPAHKPMSVRLSGTDWHDDGVSEDDLIAIARAFADAGCDLIDVSAGQTVPDQKPVYGRMFQVQFAEAVRNLTGVATMAVGNITEAAQINTIVHTRRADLVAVGRAHLSNPFFTHQAAAGYGVRRPTSWPRPYLSGADQAWREGPKIREKQQELQRKAKPSSHGEAST
jgi:anthraniloyl-CoA monooxygenase